MAYQTPEAYVLDHRSKYNPILARYGFRPDEYQKELVEVKKIIEESFKNHEPATYDEIMKTYTI